MIEFEIPKPIQMTNTALETVAVNMMRNGRGFATFTGIAMV